MGFRQSPLESLVNEMDLSFYQGKRVFVTGHTGFKGSWLSRILLHAGAEVAGYSLPPETDPNLFSFAELDEMRHYFYDIRDFRALSAAMLEFQPEIVLHLAAQPIVRIGYRNPVETYEVNVVGTVNLLESVRKVASVRSVVNVTTDKVYLNSEWAWGYRESDPLDGFDPYSNSKSCSELVTHCYRRSFLEEKLVAVSTARAGNVIGGGDFAPDRIIPDCIRAALSNQTIIVRNPHSTRPYQHVLEPVMAYLMIAERQYKDASLAGSYNIGPNDQDCVTTGDLVRLFCELWGEGAHWEARPDNGPHEANFLKLDCSKAKQTFGWKPVWHIDRAVAETVVWTKSWKAGASVTGAMHQQIEQYLKEST